MEPLKRLAREIHRRSIWQVMSVYAVGGWIAFEIVQSLTEGLGLPDWFPGLAFVLLIIGVPMVLATAIVQEGIGGPEAPPSGHVAGTPAPPPSAPTAADKLFTWKNAIGGGVLAFALWGVIAAGWLLIGPQSIASPVSGASGSDGDRKTIAVLPFASVRTDEDSESFRVGLHDELLTQLVKVGDLRVTSRTSVQEYENTTKNVREIGQELGVMALVEGGVQREGDSVKINVQLIDVEADEHLWAETYTRRVSAANIIGMQGEVVRDIARTLRAVLSPTEERRLSDIPTDNLEAYDYYLRGRAREASRANEELLAAEAMYQRAVELDPDFALAHVRLGIVHNGLFWFGVDPTEERLRKCLASIERAFELRPDLPEGHLALARYHYQGRRNYERALSELELAEARGISDAELYTVLGAIARRTGDLDRSVIGFSRAFELDPRSAGLAWDIANTLTALRRYEEAERYYDRAIEIAPTEWTPYRRKAWNHIAWRGDLAEARRILAEGERNGAAGDPGEVSWNWHELELMVGDPEAALRHAQSIGEGWVQLQVGHVSGHSLQGEAYWRIGEADLAERHFVMARDAFEARLAGRPDDPFVLQALSWTHARLGDHDEAVRLAQRAVALMPLARDSWLGPDLMLNLAAVYTVADRPEEAVDILGQLLAIPARAVSRQVLRLDPTWDPLRRHAGFQALVSES